jgi:hypothetical protein
MSSLKAAVSKVYGFRWYARRRKAMGLPGGTHRAVAQAIESGRLDRSLARDASGKVIGIADPALADSEWLARSDASKVPDPASTPPIPPPAATAEPDDGESYTAARTREKIAQANQRELEFLETAGELVRAADIEAEMADAFTQCKTKLLAIPSRAKQEMPHLTLNDLAKFDDLIREALEDLASRAAPSAELDGRAP